jgi:hypothetical protein
MPGRLGCLIASPSFCICVPIKNAARKGRVHLAILSNISIACYKGALDIFWKNIFGVFAWSWRELGGFLPLDKVIPEAGMLGAERGFFPFWEGILARLLQLNAERFAAQPKPEDDKSASQAAG